MKKFLFISIIALFVSFSTIPADALTKDMVFLQRSRGATSLWAVNINTGRGVKILENPELHANRHSTVSPDERLVAWSNGRVYLFDHTTGKFRMFNLNDHPINKQEYRGLKFLPDGSLLTNRIFRSGDNDIPEMHQYFPRTHRVERMNAMKGVRLFATTFNDDGKLSVYNSADLQKSDPRFKEKAIVIAHGSKRTTVKLPVGIKLESCRLGFFSSFSPNSNYLAFPCGDDTLLLVDSSTGKVHDQWKLNRKFSTLGFGHLHWLSDSQVLVEMRDLGIVPFPLELTIYTIHDNKLWKTMPIVSLPDDGKTVIGDIKVRGDQIVYTLESKSSVSSPLPEKLFKYSLQTGKTTLILTGKQNETLELF